MLEFLKFVGGWLFFMGVIVLITLAVPRIAKHFEGMWRRKKEAMQKEKELYGDLPQENENKEK